MDSAHKIMETHIEILRFVFVALEPEKHATLDEQRHVRNGAAV